MSVAKKQPPGQTPCVTCPTCGASVPWNAQSRWRPFCSERCKLIDLGQWLDESHRISTPGGADSGGADDSEH